MTISDVCLVRHCVNFTVTFAYLTTQELYVTFACLIHHSFHRFRTQSLITRRHSNIRLRRVFRHCLFCVLSVFLAVAVRHATVVRRQLPLHLFAPVAFCNQTCLPLPTATPVHSRPPPVTHPLTYRPSSPLPHVDLSLLARAFCDQQRCACCLYTLPCCCYSRCAPRHVRPAVFHPSISAVV